MKKAANQLHYKETGPGPPGFCCIGPDRDDGSIDLRGELTSTRGTLSRMMPDNPSLGATIEVRRSKLYPEHAADRHQTCAW